MTQLRSDFEALSLFGKVSETEGWSRLAFGDADCAAHSWFAARATSSGLATRFDAFGNVIARLGPKDGPAIAVGSHLDTVTNGGAFDGAIGVLAGLEVARRIQPLGNARCAFEVIAFRDEEGRFGPLCGSRAMMGVLLPEDLARLKSVDGASLADALVAVGLSPEGVSAATRDEGELAAYLELHIEQGPVLEAAGVPLGIVTTIVGQRRMSIRFLGQAGHAGTVPMDRRRDAFSAATLFAERFREFVLASEGGTLRGTIGIANISPNLGNVIPGVAQLALELRDVDDETLSQAADMVERLARQAAEDRGCESKVRRQYQEKPIAMNAGLREVLAKSILGLNARFLELPSGANHDAGIIGRRIPIAMLFVPSINGQSHCPEEFTNWDDIELAVNVLERTVCSLLCE